MTRLIIPYRTNSYEFYRVLIKLRRLTVTNITILQSEIDQFLDGGFQVHTSVNGGAVDVHDQHGWWIATLDEDEATLDIISNL